jgi:hypothetical protein
MIFFSKRKGKEFDLIKERRIRYHNACNIPYHMYLAEDHLRPSKAITIPEKTEYFYNEIEYQAYYNMMGIILRFCYDIIPNQH